MRLRDLYTEHFANWLTSGSFILRDRLSSLGIKPAFDRILTKKCVTKVWAVTSIPVYFDKHLTHLVRTMMFEMHPNVKTLVNVVNKSTRVAVKTDVFKRQLSSASNRYEDYKRFYDSLSSADQLTGKVIRGPGGQRIQIRTEDLNRLKERYDSYATVYEHTIKGGQFFHSYVFIQASAKTNREMNEYRRSLQDLMAGLGVTITELQGNISHYLMNFGPAGYLSEEHTKFPYMLMSDQNIAGLSAYKTRGLVGGKGILMGVDKFSKLPFFLSFTSSTAVQVILMIGLSGWGKTFLANMKAMGLGAEDVHVSVVDIKGGEWEKAKEFMPTLVISMDDKSSSFVNTMRLDDLDVSKDDASFMYYTAIHGTVQLFSTLVNLQPNEGNIADLEMVLEIAATKVMDMNKVFKDNPETFVKTRNIKYSDVVDVVGQLGETSQSLTEDQKKLCELVVSRTTPYFKMEGRYSEAFKNEITLREVLDTKLVVYSFNKNNNMTMGVLDNVKAFMAKFLSMKKQFVRKSQGLFTADFYEEVQRVDNNLGNMLNFISQNVTGSRSNNVIIFLLLNAISSFSSKDAEAIKSNVSTVVAGRLYSKDIQVIAETFDCHDLVPYMELINSDDPAYKYCFAIKYNNGITIDKTVYKAVPPVYVEEELRTRDVVPVT